nr:MAG TPA: hypothetical protein [Crassvirales sp.]
MSICHYEYRYSKMISVDDRILKQNRSRFSATN